ncbi:MAG: aldo/keto reductase [Deltaproteobacteria bacterium]|nr:aldo/keto reductase [Deltaproteobacteria bacterium]
MPYGIANRKGQPGPSESEEIVAEAWENGIREFDTAQDYGTSETVLGQALKALGLSQKAGVFTKFHPSLNHLHGQALKEALSESLERLGLSQLSGILLHREKFLDHWNRGLGETLLRFKEEKVVRKIGVSVYRPERALQALETEGIDLVQVPMNLFDRRFLDQGVFGLAERLGKGIYVRSIFLQGLLLMKPEELPEKMAFAKSILKNLDSVCRELVMERPELALLYIKSAAPRASVVFGAESVSQLKQNISCWKRDVDPSLPKRIHMVFGSVDDRILNPALWPPH